jgi:undecaprenyl-diphosphatase
VSLLHAFILGIVQGLTEFLPISSSGHITLVPFMLGFPEPTLAFAVAVHLGTLAAVVYVFQDDVRVLVRTLTRWSEASEPNRLLVRLLGVATIPAVIAGVRFEAAISASLDKPVLVAFLLGITGYWLMSTETKIELREEPLRSGDDLSMKDALGIGVAQAVAILPGISRSGATIGAGMRMGLSRSVAARFSFLMSIPVILGATVFQMKDVVGQGMSGSGPAFVIGAVTSAVSGTIAIRWFLRLVQARSLRPFGVYLSFAMIAGLLTALARG